MCVAGFSARGVSSPKPTLARHRRRASAQITQELRMYLVTDKTDGDDIAGGSRLLTVEALQHTTNSSTGTTLLPAFSQGRAPQRTQAEISEKMRNSGAVY